MAEYTLAVPGAHLHYDVRGSGPVLALIGLPMTAPEFTPLAEELADTYTVVTYDPRGYGRSPIDDPEQDTTPALAAEDVQQVLSRLGSEPVRVFGSSGGAVTAMALITQHPTLVHTAVLHEPPVVRVLPDAEELLGVVSDIRATFRAGDPETALGAFLSFAGFTVDETLGEPPPGRNSAQSIANAQRMLDHSLVPTASYHPNLSALRSADTTIVVAAGQESEGTLAHRTAHALATQLDTTAAPFPGDHTGFVDHDGSGAAPQAFARVLREFL